MSTVKLMEIQETVSDTPYHVPVLEEAKCWPEGSTRQKATKVMWTPIIGGVDELIQKHHHATAPLLLGNKSFWLEANLSVWPTK